MRRALLQPCVVTCAALALAAGLILLGSCSPSKSDRSPQVRSLFVRIDSLRVIGHYAEALDSARRLDALASKPGARIWQINDAHRLKSTLVRIVSLSPAGRREMAEADSLTPVIERLMNVDENYVAAMNAASRQLELRGRQLGTSDPEVATSLHVLGEIANQSGEGERCEEYLEKALAIRRAQLGPRHPLVAETLREWGILMKTRLELPKAESAYMEALSILETAYPRDDVNLAPVLESLGSLHRLCKRFGSAEKCYLRALRIRRLHSGERSIEVAENLVWLGYARMYASRLDRAEESLLQARDILREHGMNISHSMGNVLWNLAMIAWLRGDTGHAAELWEQYALCPTNAAGSHPQGFGLARLRGLVGEWIDALLCERRYDTAWQELCRDSGPVAQSLLNLSAARRRWSGEAARLDSLRAEVLTLRQLINAGNGSRPPGATAEPPAAPGGSAQFADPLQIRLARVDGQRMVLEQELLTRFSATVEGRRITPEEIQSRLAPDQAIVGWAPGVWGLPGMFKGTLWAYVLRDKGPVHWIHLGTWNDPDEYRSWSRSSFAVYRAILRSSQWPHRVAADPGLDSLAVDSWRKVFQPLVPCLRGVRELIVIDGRANPVKLVPVLPECLVDDQGVPLIERFAFSFVPSPAVFARLVDDRKRNPDYRRSIIAVGDPLGPPMSRSEQSDYAAAEIWSSGEEGHFKTTFISPSLARSALAGDREALSRLPRLPDSRREVLKAASVFSVSQVFLGPEATRTALASALQRAHQLGVLHLATHALVDGGQPERSLLVMSMAGSGSGRETVGAGVSAGRSVRGGRDLIGAAAASRAGGLAGAAAASLASDATGAGAASRAGGLAGASGISGGPDLAGADLLDSGCITAEEVLLGPQLDVDLVTLSGCQTYYGSGAPGGEDLGFAQSFLAAGARCLLLSRWKVDDQATALLMGRFYENMTGSYSEPRAGVPSATMSKTRALQEAQNWLRRWQAPDGSIPFAHPVYWAGFVLLGAAS